MNRKLTFFSFLLVALFAWGCKKTATPDQYNRLASDPELLHKCSEQLTDVIVYDIFKPPVASRIYAYAYLASYETLRQQATKQYPSLAGKLNNFPDVPKPEAGKEYCLPLASVKALCTVGRTLTFSADRWDTFEKDFYKKYEEMGIPEEVYARSVAYGEQVAKHVLDYAGKDNYKQTRGFRHTLAHKPGSWEPTPPTYVEACEPRWNTVRSFTLDSASQFMPPPPAAFDMNTKSAFYQLAKEVYDINVNMTEEQKSIAYFWDDNAFVSHISGHATFAEKKMTPPGHWVAITRTVARNQKADMMKSMEAYSLASIALYDAFITCWDAKYKTDRIRPVTVIQKSFDPKWMPFLETPAFPEYVSGHSSISAAAGRVLTHIFGDNVAFTDSTEHRYGHGVRSFKSFEHADWDTTISRVYGGIHFRDGVEQGTYQGEKVGNWVLNKLKGVKPKEPEMVRTVKNESK